MDTLLKMGVLATPFGAPTRPVQFGAPGVLVLGVRQHSWGAPVHLLGCFKGVVSHYMGAPLALQGCSRIHHRVFTITAYTSVGCFCALPKIINNTK